MTGPTPFVDPDILPYVPDEDDKYLPSPGFVTDFVAALRGVETPTIFCIWSALWMLSAASCRLAYVEWIEEMPLFPNLYVFLVAPPGRCHKSTAIKFATKALMGLGKKFDLGTAHDGFLRYMADFNWATSKTTPDALYEMLKPAETLVTGTDKAVTVKRGSQLTLSVSELAVFLNKKKFNVGLIDTLTDLYDCNDKDVINTISRGPQELKDIFVTFIGATTPTGMKESLPHEAFGEGFMSRATVVYKDKTARKFPEPVHFDGFPTLDDLRERLAWIMRNKLGVYKLTKDARDWYNKWYDGWRDDLDSDDRYSERVAEFRFDVNMKRLAILLSMGRYDTEKVITKQDLMDAHVLLKGTYKTSVKANAEAGIAVTEFNGEYGKVVEYLKKCVSVDRSKLTSNMSSKGVPMATVKDVLKQLLVEGRLECVERGISKDVVNWTKGERYHWVERTQVLKEGA